MTQLKTTMLRMTMCVPAMLCTCANAGTPPTVDGQAEVRLEAGEVIEDINATYGTTTLDIAVGTSRPHYLLEMPVGLSAADFVALAGADNRIKSADFNYEIGNPMPSTQSLFFPRVGLEYWNQQARHIIGLNRELSPGLAPNNGPVSQVIVAVVDTGVDLDHPLLISSLVAGTCVLPGETSTDDLPNGVDEDGDGLFDETTGHGTFVAGLVHYVAPNAQIMPVRAMTSDGTTTSFIVAKGILAAVTGGVHVINVSLGTQVEANVIADAIESAEALGIMVVASAGNDGFAQAQFPAGSSVETSVAGVAGTNDSDVLVTYSNFGSGVTLCAPSEMLVSSFPGGEYRAASGTSFASALVTGAIARMLAAAPGTTPSTLRATLSATAKPIDALNPGFEGMLGAGRLDAGSAFAHVGITPPFLPGDFNGDGASDLDDLNILLAHFGSLGPIADIDGNGTANLNDLQLLLYGFGRQ